VPGGDKYTFPTLTDAPSALVCVPIPVIPFFRRFFSEMQQRNLWQTRDDWLRAYGTFSQIEADMMSGCLQELVESNNRIYRLLDTTLNGAEYTATPDGLGGYTVAPEIAPAPSASSPAELPAYGLRPRLERLINLLDNLSTGQLYPEIGPALSAGALDDSIGLRATVRRVTAGLDGGGDVPPGDNVLIALRGEAPGDIQNNVLSRLKRLTEGLDGGGEYPPGDNILVALRGTAQASETRNVIDAQGGNLSDLLDQVETLLTEIRDKLI